MLACSESYHHNTEAWFSVLAICVQVNAEAIKIGKEAEEANAIASECQAGLDKALPALQAAEDALNVLTKKDMSELKVSHTCLSPALLTDIHSNACSSMGKVHVLQHEQLA